MEDKVAILMADLSGYTALTETHGPVSAADLIDKYILIAESCLVGDSRIHERRGDEIMIISDSPDSLLATALKLESNTICEENFLQVHGGLHFGKVLKRADNYFGSAINLVSRIAAKAASGTFWCSADFVDSIENKSLCCFVSKGIHTFKNITGEKEVFEVCIDRINTNYIDPVCRMVIVNRQNAIYHPDGGGHYFCSPQCLEIYKENYRSLQNLQNEK
jgi:class 3 adenylate cyclase/YHS domain-containing protein